MLAAIGCAMITSWMPLMSPTFQSFFGLSGWLLWQLTQAGPIVTGATRRTLSENSEVSVSTIFCSGSLRSASSASFSNLSSWCAARFWNGKSETKR